MRRRADRLSITALAVSLLVAAVVAAFGFPALLDVNRLSRENDRRIGEVSSLAREVARLVDAINDERERNTAADCRIESKQNERIVRYLDSLGAPPPRLDEARRFFPVLTPAQCAAQAARRVNP